MKPLTLVRQIGLTLFIVSVVLTCSVQCYAGPVTAAAPIDGHITVDMRPGSLVNSFIPDRTIGAGVDAVGEGQVKNIYTPENIAQILTAGDGALSYRLYTELSVQQWHWNPSGTWSDPVHHSGYFIGDTDSSSFVRDTYGYDLPRRGQTHDQGNDDGYSRLDDGDSKTYWKSNPYLTSTYTGESDTLHPQWVIVDLGAPKPIDAVHIDWVNPYATSFDVQYCTGGDPIGDMAKVRWHEFPSGTVNDSRGGSMTVRIAPAPMNLEFVRVLMTVSSGTYSDESATDPRSAMGYAISEIGVGTVDANGVFRDLVVHTPDRKQTNIYCSSVDPWHTAENREKAEEQPGFDTVFRSGITRGLPAMVSVPIVYDTPQDAVAELAFIQKRGYKIAYVEMGEEAEEQWMTPEDYGSLFCQWVAAIHAKFPDLKLGGPVFASHTGVRTWANAAGNTDWLSRFYTYLKTHGHAQELAFYSFEYYPSAAEGFKGTQLLDSPDDVAAMLGQKRVSGLPDSIPAFLTEYNIGDSSQQQPDLYGAVWHADFVADFLSHGGKGIYFYEYEPLPLSKGGGGYGSFSMFSSDKKNNIRQPLSQYFSSRLTNLYWCDPLHADMQHDLYPATSDIPKVAGHDSLTAYAVHRPYGRWSVMLINKSDATDYDVTISFAKEFAKSGFTGKIHRAQFGPAQYVFHQKGIDGYASPDGPEKVDVLRASPSTVYHLPARSITVVTGSVG